LAAPADGRVLVADRENNRIQVFDRVGAFLAEWTSVQRPTAIVVDAAGLVFVTEFARSRGHFSWRNGTAERESPAALAILDSDGRLLARLGFDTPAGTPGGFIAPHGLAMDSAGDLYVAEVTGTVLPARAAAGDAVPSPSGGGFATFQKLARVG
jgi:hypothetical protein